jgi:hypothetical protein
MNQNEFRVDPHHVGLPSVAPKMISKPIVHSAQTMHLSCVEINTISKQSQTSFHLTYNTRNIIRYAQSDFGAYGTFDVNPAPIFPRD